MVREVAIFNHAWAIAIRKLAFDDADLIPERARALSEGVWSTYPITVWDMRARYGYVIYWDSVRRIDEMPPVLKTRLIVSSKALTDVLGMKLNVYSLHDIRLNEGQFFPSDTWFMFPVGETSCKLRPVARYFVPCDNRCLNDREYALKGSVKPLAKVEVDVLYADYVPEQVLLRYARGDWQRSITHKGYISMGQLRGKARHYALSYEQSVNNYLNRLKDAGYQIYPVHGPHGGRPRSWYVTYDTPIVTFK